MNRGGFSWSRFFGISAFKSNVSRHIGIPLTRSGRQRKLGAFAGTVVGFAIIFCIAFIGIVLAFVSHFLLKKYRALTKNAQK